MSSTAAVVKPIHDPRAERRAVIMVAAATIVCAAAQILMKLGADYSRAHPGLAGLITDIPLVAGYALYALMTVLIVIAFKDGELSVLYPIISLSYVWVTALSYFVFHDSLNTWKMTGLGFIIAGVAVIGRGSKA